MTNRSVEERVLAHIGRAMGEFSMLRPGDRVAVGVSGGKDSLCLVDALAVHRRHAPFDYDMIALTLEQGKFHMPARELENQMKTIGVEWVLRDEPRTLSLVEDGVEHGCEVCSRNRRGELYRTASELGCTVLALGHTADDCREALLRNICFNGRIASLPPVSESRKGSMRLIRPLVYVSEELTSAYTLDKGLNAIGCVCSEKEGPRSEIRQFFEMMQSRHIDVNNSVSAALGNVNPYTLFDRKLHKKGSDLPLL